MDLVTAVPVILSVPLNPPGGQVASNRSFFARSPRKAAVPAEMEARPEKATPPAGVGKPTAVPPPFWWWWSFWQSVKKRGRRKGKKVRFFSFFFQILSPHLPLSPKK